MKVERLRLLREKMGLTQGEAAKKLNIVRTTYSNYEAGNREPDLETIKKFADFFEVSVDYLLGMTDNKEIKKPAQKLLDYLEMELTDEEIIDRMTFKVDDLTLSDEEVREFIAFVRAKRFMKKGLSAASKSEEL